MRYIVQLGMKDHRGFGTWEAAEVYIKEAFASVVQNFRYRVVGVVTLHNGEYSEYQVTAEVVDTREEVCLGCVFESVEK